MLSKVFDSLYILILLIQGIDLFKSRESFSQITGIESNTILVIFIGLILFLRFFSIRPFSQRIKTINQYILFPIFLCTGTLLTLIDAITPINYVYSATQFNYQELIYLSFASGILTITMQSNLYIKNHYKKLLVFLGGLMLFAFLLASTWPFNELKELVKEDHFVENMQFTTLFLSGVLSILLSVKFFSQSKVLIIFFLFLAVGFFLVAGDEISWGQRLFNIQTPQYLNEINNQQEITIHNIRGVDLFVIIGYLLASLYGLTSWFFVRFSKKINKARYSFLFIPSPSLFLFFGFSFLYNFRTSLGDHNLGVWSEIAELFLYMGIFFHLLICFCKLHPQKFK